MKTVVAYIEWLVKRLGQIASWSALVMMLFQAASVLMRYVFNYGLITFQEAVIYGHALLFLLGAAYVLQTNQHVRVDLFYDHYSGKTKKVFDVIALLFFVVPVGVVVTWFSWPYVDRAWGTLEGSRQAGGIPAIFILKTAIIVFSITLILQAIATTARLFMDCPNKEWQPFPKSEPQEQ